VVALDSSYPFYMSLTAFIINDLRTAVSTGKLLWLIIIADDHAKPMLLSRANNTLLDTP
jgi:hypothetical protein